PRQPRQRQIWRRIAADRDLNARIDRELRQEIRAVDRRDAKNARRRQRVRQQGRPEIWRAAAPALACFPPNNQKKGTPDVLDKSASLTAPPTTVTRTKSAVPRALQKYLSLD